MYYGSTHSFACCGGQGVNRFSIQAHHYIRHIHCPLWSIHLVVEWRRLAPQATHTVFRCQFMTLWWRRITTTSSSSTIIVVVFCQLPNYIRMDHAVFMVAVIRGGERVTRRHKVRKKPLDESPFYRLIVIRSEKCTTRHVRSFKLDPSAIIGTHKGTYETEGNCLAGIHAVHELHKIGTQWWQLLRRLFRFWSDDFIASNWDDCLFFGFVLILTCFPMWFNHNFIAKIKFLRVNFWGR